MIEFGHTMQSSLNLCTGRRIFFSLFRFIISVRSNVDKLESACHFECERKKNTAQKMKTASNKTKLTGFCLVRHFYFWHEWIFNRRQIFIGFLSWQHINDWHLIYLFQIITQIEQSRWRRGGWNWFPTTATTFWTNSAWPWLLRKSCHQRTYSDSFTRDLI